MSELIASGRIVDLILALVVLEAAALMAFWRRARRGIAPADLLGNLLSGDFLLLALRAALAAAWWGWIALCFAAALAAHLADLWRRWPPTASR